MTQKPQPYYDIELAKISRWLIRNQMTCHVSKAGNVELNKRPPDECPSAYRLSIIRRAQEDR